MERLIILGCLCILIVNAQDVVNDITVEYAKVTKTSDGGGEKSIISLCNVNVPDVTDDKSVAVLTIQQKGENSNPDDGENINGEINGNCLQFDFSDHQQFMEKQNDIFLKVIVTSADTAEKIKKETIHEFKGKFTFTEFDDTKLEVKTFKDGTIIQFKNGNVSPLYITVKEDNNPATKTVECKEDKSLCVHILDDNIEGQSIQIYNAETDDIPNSSPKKVGAAITCDGVVDVSTVYDNDNKDGFTFSGKDVANTYAVSDSEVFYNIELTLKPAPIPKMFVLIKGDICEQIPVKVRDMDFLKPFDNTVEVSWDHDDAPGQNKYYLEVNGVTDVTLIKNLHIDCSQDDLTTCIAYVFDDKITDEAQIQFELSESVENEPPTPGKMKTKETYTVPSSQPDGKKSLKTLNVNQFEINWNTKQGKLCLEDSLFKKSQKSQYKYELVIGFDEGNWKKYIANYNDESTTCFNDFEVTELIENKLGVHFLVMKRESDTNQIVASDMITTDLIVPEISEVNDETISLEFENLNSPFLIRDEKTKQIISKNEKKIHNLSFLKSSHEKKSIFNRNLVLETRKEHTQMKVHFKIPQKVNAA